MSPEGLKTFPFRWRSRLGVAAALFLLYGAVNVLAAILVPLMLHLSGPARSGLLLNPAADDALLGRPLEQVVRAEPRLAAYLVSFMDTMCAFMFAYGVVYLGVTWFALRRAQPWALGMLTLGGLAWLPHYVLVGLTYTALGVTLSLGDVAPFLGFGVPVLVAAALGWWAPQRVHGRVPAPGEAEAAAALT